MMRSLSALALACFLALAGCSQSETADPPPAETEAETPALTQESVQGEWSGKLQVPGGPGLWLVFHVGEDETGGLTVTMDSPEQGAMGIAGEDARLEDNVFAASFPLIGAQFTMQPGEKGAMQGVWVQGLPILFVLERGNNVPRRPRPQEPETRDYVLEAVSFPGAEEGVTLAGEITLPQGEGPFPGVVLISGSGPQDRNEELMGHKPFLVLSDYLTRRGYAVLRYDDRGFGESTGDFGTATSEDFAGDAAAALDFLKDDDRVDAERTSYVGHSEGGLIAPMAVQTEPSAAMVLLAGPAVSLSDVILRQTGDMLRAEGGSEGDIEKAVEINRGAFDIVRSGGIDEESVEDTLTAYFTEAGMAKAAAESAASRMTGPWMVWAMDYDPVPALKAYDGPVLALFGSKDTQVSADANAPVMEEALSDLQSRVVTLDGLNHLFQPAETGGLSEYIEIETTFDDAALNEIADWLDEVLAPE